MTETTARRQQITVTLLIEHVDGPHANEHWEQNIPAAIEVKLMNEQLVVGARGARYEITDVVVDDTAEVPGV